MKVIFMGTPEFAVPSLRALADFEIQAVFCQPDRPKGRSKKPVPCPVKEAALEMGVPVHQPKRIRAKKWVSLIREMSPDLIVVAAFGQILPQSILDVPSVDCVNVHASILPRWRGASPIHYSILEGDRFAGVAIMKMLMELDAGPYYSLDQIEVGEMGRVELETKLAQMGADLLLKTIPDLKSIEPVIQDETDVTYAPIIQRHFGFVDFEDAFYIERATRAFEVWPQVQCAFREQPVKLLKVRAESREHGLKPGEILEVTRKNLVVACGANSVLHVRELQPSGKKPQPATAFINGYRPEPGEMFVSLERPNP